MRLSFACWDYDRTRALQDGRVRPEGIELTILPLQVEETFYRQLRHQEFDVCELSLSSYVLTLNEPDPPYVALPVFPSRMFRHQSMYINTTSGIETPADLAGKRIGTPEYQMTAGVWQRGLMADEYGVAPTDMHYLTGAIEQSGRREKLPLDLPAEFDVQPIGPGRNLSDMLAEGEIDAIFSASQPPCLGRSPSVRHLFPDFKRVEQDWYRRNHIFPIMHVVAIRRAVFERDPWIARSLYKAFDESLQIAYGDLRHRNALKVMLPWLHEHVTETIDVLGDGYWDYGLGVNQAVLERFARYSYEQGLANKLWEPAQLVLSQAEDSYRM